MIAQWGRRLAQIAAIFVVCALLTGARYRAREGDTYKRVASAFGVDEDLLRKWNPRVPELKPGTVIVIPEVEITGQHKWSPARPFAPPKPTVSQLLEQIESGAVVAVLKDDSGVFVMRAGEAHDIEIGELRPRRRGTAIVHDVYLRADTGQIGRAKAIGWTGSFKPPSVEETPAKKGRVHIPVGGCGIGMR